MAHWGTSRRSNVWLGLMLFISLVWGASTAQAAIIVETFDLDEPHPSSPVQVLNGLSARAIFTLDTGSPRVLKIELFDTSTGLPAGFDNADQILTGISFDFNPPGFNGEPKIDGGTVVIGPGGYSIDFDQIVPPAPQLGEYADVSGEWGYGNMDGTGLLTNLVSACRSETTWFTGTNWDGPVNIDGPQGGIITGDSGVDLGLGGLGAVADSVIITLSLDQDVTSLDFLYDNGVLAEFGSDAAFVSPEPASLALLLIGSLALLRKRKA